MLKDYLVTKLFNMTRHYTLSIFIALHSDPPVADLNVREQGISVDRYPNCSRQSRSRPSPTTS